MYQKVLVPLDGSQLAECVLPHLEALVKGCRPAQVVLARVLDSERLPIASESWGARLQARLERAREAAESQERSQAEQYLSDVEKRLKLGAAEKAVIEGVDVAEALLEYAKANGVDLIVIASHGRSGVSRWLWGSVADRILHGGCVPVLMVRAPGCGLVAAEYAKASDRWARQAATSAGPAIASDRAGTETPQT